VAGVYSEQFILYSGAPANLSYVVPTGKRAIVKSMFAWNGDSAAKNRALLVDGKVVWISPVPGANGLVSVALMLVLYSGQTLGAVSYSDAGSLGVAGYLLATG
jgi:hypothetical protein